MNDYNYQLNFSSHHEVLYDLKQREQKANKILSILIDYLGNLDKLCLLDVGCSTGIMTNLLSHRFKSTIGIDIDEEGVAFAKQKFSRDNLTFSVKDAMNMEFPDNFIDVITCSHIYEHVPDSQKLVLEIHRVLKPGGVCFFAAANRIAIKDPEYGLPLLSILPKFMAHRYVRIIRRADFYYENFLTYWQLKKLVSNFKVIDYTKKVIGDPEKFCATDMIRNGSMSQKIILFILKYVYWLCPTYIWLLKKSDCKN